jgi:hypothetical protein
MASLPRQSLVDPRDSEPKPSGIESDTDILLGQRIEILLQTSDFH